MRKLNMKKLKKIMRKFTCHFVAHSKESACKKVDMLS